MLSLFARWDMRRYQMFGAVLVLVGAATTEAAIWAESFENGVGRLSETRGDADTLTYWSSTEQSIDGTTFRTSRVDQRYAPVGPLSASSPQPLGSCRGALLDRVFADVAAGECLTRQEHDQADLSRQNQEADGRRRCFHGVPPCYLLVPHTNRRAPVFR